MPSPNLFNRAWTFVAILLLLGSTVAFSAESMRPASFRMSFLGLGRAAFKSDRSHEIRTQMMAGDKVAVSYFLDREPDGAEVPAGASEIVIGKVRLRQKPVYLAHRDVSGRPAKDAPKDLFFIRVEIVEPRKGAAAVGEVFEVYFKRTDDKREFTFPYTPEQLRREYTVVMYLDADDGIRRLAPFPWKSLVSTSSLAPARGYRLRCRRLPA